MVTYKNMQIKDYIDVLSSKSSMPGGGTVSAINGAMGISLILMVVNLSYGKKGFIEYRDDLKYIIDEGEKLKQSFLDLIDEDVLAYNKMIEVYNMKKDSEEDKKLRSEKMQEALKVCVVPPMNVLSLCIKSLELANLACGKTTKSAESDIKIGIDNLICAVKGAINNININIQYMKNQTEIEKVEKQLNDYKNELRKNNINLS